MVLFNPEELVGGKQLLQSPRSLVVPGSPLLTLSAPSGHGLKQLSAQVLKSASLIFLMEGSLSLHHLLEAVLDGTGPADVWLGAYAITEEPARRIFRLRQANSIRRLSCLVDSKMHKNNAGAYQLLHKTADALGACPIHAKCFVVVNDRHRISVMSSANFSNNPRLELAHTSSAGDVANWNIGWMEEYMNQGRVK